MGRSFVNMCNKHPASGYMYIEMVLAIFVPHKSRYDHESVISVPLTFLLQHCVVQTLEAMPRTGRANIHLVSPGSILVSRAWVQQLCNVLGILPSNLLLSLQLRLSITEKPDMEAMN